MSVPAQTGARPELIERCITTIRTLAADAVEQARSGHPGTPIALAPAAYVLWARHLVFDPSDPAWPNRDRFVLSCGHASMLLYAMLYLTGYGLTLEDLASFRQWGSRTPGHPETGVTPGVETTTGPLGQGFANAVGMALAERLLAERFNRPNRHVIDHATWVFCSDGDLMEGLSHEAASLAGHLGLGRLNVLYDDNHITIDGDTALTFSDDVGARFAAYGWHVLHVGDGNDLEALDGAFAAARREESRPSLIVCRTHIGYGLPTKQDSEKAHGEALGEEEIRLWKERLGWPQTPFSVPDDVLEHMRGLGRRGAAARADWHQTVAAWREENPELAEEWDRRQARRLPEQFERALPAFPPGTMATRKAQARTLAALEPVLPELVGGSADLTGSNGTRLGNAPAFAPGRPGRYLHWGVREHAMAAGMNGIALHGGFRPYGGTFLIFSDYHRNAVRLAALMEIPTIFVYSHDSVGLGEDGPTHQPVEQLPGLRAIPNLVVIRPADANETVEAWRVALERTEGPTAILVTRQDVPVLDRSIFPSGLARGAYVLAEQGPERERPDLVLIGTGSEVHVALGAAEILAAEKLRVRTVSMPSWELFQAQDPAYRDAVLPPQVKPRVAVEAAAPIGWERWVGEGGAVVGLERFGASAPGGTVFAELGFTPEHVAAVARDLL